MTIVPTTPPRKPPKGLSAEARRLWHQAQIDYDFVTAAQFQLLEQLCQTSDRLRQVQREIKTEGLTTKGYKGQPKANPLLVSEDSCRKMILALQRALRLTDDEE